MSAPLPLERVRVGDFQVRQVACKRARSFVENHHYAGGMMKSPSATFGLFNGDELVGVAVFACPISENVRRSVFGDRTVNTKACLSRVTELHRLVLLDWVPYNAESHFVAEALRQLKELRPDFWFVLSFADTSFGHVGTIYQASNALWCGTAPASKFYIDETGRFRHTRQCGKNITWPEAQARGWRLARSGVKHRYGFFLPDDRKHRRQLREWLILKPSMPYPKLGYTAPRHKISSGIMAF